MIKRCLQATKYRLQKTKNIDKLILIESKRAVVFIMREIRRHTGKKDDSGIFRIEVKF